MGELLKIDLTDSLSDVMEFIELNSFNLRIVKMRKYAVEMKSSSKLQQLDWDKQ